MTAIHEAGHALTCLLVECQIDYWQILGIDPTVRRNRRLRQTSNIQSGTGLLYHDSTPHEFVIALAGYAAEGTDDFLPENAHSLEQVMQVHEEKSDQHVAWLLAAEAHAVCGDEVPDTELARRIQLTYTRMFDLFDKDPFEGASCALARYMMERGAEDDDVNGRMLRFLDVEGFTKRVRARMKSMLLDIRLPLFEASEAAENA